MPIKFLVMGEGGGRGFFWKEGGSADLIFMGVGIFPIQKPSQGRDMHVPVPCHPQSFCMGESNHRYERLFCIWTRGAGNIFKMYPPTSTGTKTKLRRLCNVPWSTKLLRKSFAEK